MTLTLIVWNTLKLRSKCFPWSARGCAAWWASLRSCRSQPFANGLLQTSVKLAQSEGKTTARGIRFQLPATHQELANQLGTVRELISRESYVQKAEGLLDVDARQIVVKDMKGLSALLDTAP